MKKKTFTYFYCFEKRTEAEPKRNLIFVVSFKAKHIKRSKVNEAKLSFIPHKKAVSEHSTKTTTSRQ